MSLEKILNAEAVAIIGASKNETKRGFQAIKILLDQKYMGRILPVNPKESRIQGLKCYQNVCDIEGEVGIALIATPARTIPGVLEDCGKKGVCGAVILAVGFGEIGREGKKLELKIIEIAKKYGIRLIGPNTSGMMNMKINLNLVGLSDVPKGNIALLTQSGNMALTLITEAKLKSLQGISYYIGVGNEADINFHEYLDFFKNDPDTKVIIIYVEGMRDGRKFLQSAYKTSLEKPIVLLKSGRTSTGRKSAGSHTGALAGMSEVARTAFKRAGITVIQNSDELFPAAESLANLPPFKNRQVAILADGGGHATIAADFLTDLGLQLPELGERTREQLRKILPAAASVRNPVDVAGGADSNPLIFAQCADILMKDYDIGGVLVVGLFGGYGIRFASELTLIEEDAAHTLGKMVQKRDKPLIMHSLYASEKTHPLHLLRYYNIPVYDSLEIACKCMAVLSDYGRYLKSYHARTNFDFNWGKKRKSEGAEFFQKAKKEGRRALLEYEAKQLLALHGAPVKLDHLARNSEEAVAFAQEIGQPVAMKIVSPDILHKSDAGGVRLDISGQDAVITAFNSMKASAEAYKPGADFRGVLVTPMADPGIEVIIGTKIDEQFGPIIMFGLGGVMVEILKDVSFRVLPISNNSAKKMIREIKAYPILAGARGQNPCDLKALRRLLLICSEIVESYMEIVEMDLNPVIVYEEGVSIVDARIIF